MNRRSNPAIQTSAAPPANRTEETKLRTSLEADSADELMIVHCQGRSVYRDEAAALARLVTRMLEVTNEVVLNLEGVEIIDSAGLGDLVLLHTWAKGLGKTVKLAGPNARVQGLIELTNLASVFQVYPTLDDAMESREISRLV